MVDALIAVLHETAFIAGFWGIVLFAFAQEVIPPIPSSVFAVTLGFAFFAGTPITFETLMQTVTAVGIPLAIGLTVGAACVYSVFYWGGRPFVVRYGSFIGVSWDDIERMRTKFDGKHTDDVLFFVARSFPLVPSVALNTFAGIVRWRFVPFVVLTFFGTIFRGSLTAFIGWQAGSAFMHYAELIERYSSYVLYVIVAGLVAFVVVRKQGKLSH